MKYSVISRNAFLPLLLCSSSLLSITFGRSENSGLFELRTFLNVVSSSFTNVMISSSSNWNRKLYEWHGTKHQIHVGQTDNPLIQRCCILYFEQKRCKSIYYLFTDHEYWVQVCLMLLWRALLVHSVGGSRINPHYLCLRQTQSKGLDCSIDYNIGNQMISLDMTVLVVLLIPLEVNNPVCIFVPFSISFVGSPASLCPSSSESNLVWFHLYPLWLSSNNLLIVLSCPPADLLPTTENNIS